MKLKPVPSNLVVHTPSEEEAKELLAILHENGYKWNAGKPLASHTNWEVYESNTYYYIYPTKLIVAFGDDRSVLRSGQHTITLTEFKERYCEAEKPQPKFDKGQKVRITNKKHPHYGHKGKIGEVFSYDPKYDRYMINGIPSEWESGDLEPYTEPETKPTEGMETEGKQKGEKGNNSENSQLNLSEKREESICKELYEALFQLEQASQRVRKILIRF